MKYVPLFGSGIASSSYPVTRQRRLNVYFENRPDGDKTKIACFGTPGLAYQSISQYWAYARGITSQEATSDVFGSGSFLYRVEGGNIRVYKIGGAENTVYAPFLTTSTGPVSMAASGTQVIAVDGTGGAYYDVSTSAYGPITSGGFPNGAKTVTFCSGYFVCEQPGSQKFWVSNLFDGTTWNALAFASASQYPDTIVAVDSLIGTLILFSTTHTEFWQNIGATPEPFAPILAATVEFGLAAIWSRAHVDNSLIALCVNRQGAAQVVQFSGYSAKVISTQDLDNLLSTFPSDIANGTALTYTVNGHPMYQLTFPTADTGVGRSFLYDTSTGLWGDAQTGTTAQAAARHIGQYSTAVNGVNYITDYQSGLMYAMDPNTFTDNGATIEREVVSRHISTNFNVFSVDEVYLDMETGVGAGQVMMQYSKDNGRTWSTERWVSIGDVGQYQQRVIWRQCGSARDFVFRFRMTDPYKFVITEAACSFRERQQ